MKGRRARMGKDRYRRHRLAIRRGWLFGINLRKLCEVWPITRGKLSLQKIQKAMEIAGRPGGLDDN